MAFTPQNKPTKVVFLGDSITEGGMQPSGYISLVKNALNTVGKSADYTLVGAGISGNKVPDLQARLEKDVLDENPDLVFVYIGINDVWHFNEQGVGGTSEEAFEDGLQDVISRIQDTGAEVVICTPSVIGEKASGDNERDKMLDKYADISRKLAQENNLPLCDLRKAFMEYLAVNNKNNQSEGILTTDGVHLNAAGNAFVALQMMPFLLEK